METLLLIIITLAAVTAAICLFVLYHRATGKISTLEVENATLRERANLLNAPRVLTEQTRSDIGEALRPMRETMDSMKSRLEENFIAESRERHTLNQNLHDLTTLGRSLSTETRRLSDTLQGNSRVQGQWGEMVLEHMLEEAGLRRGKDFEVQVAIADESHRGRPDVVVNYTGDRHIIIDSKTSMADYMAYCSASSDLEREHAGKAHVASVRKHVGELRTKAYQDYLGKNNADFVLMFMPNEGAYMAAMQLAPELWEEAWNGRVIIISPSHLLAMLKLIGQLWRAEKQNRNVAEIARQAGEMLDKFQAFIDDMERVGRSLKGAQSAHESALAKLSGPRGSLLNRAAKIKNLGAKSVLATDGSPEDESEDACAQRRFDS